MIVIGGGLAGLAAGVALAEAGWRARLFEQRPFLGGRATSYALPGGEHVDNCQHVTLGCCTNLEDFYRRVGATNKIKYFDRLVFLDPQGRRGEMQAGVLPVLIAPVGLDDVVSRALDHAAPPDAALDIDVPGELPEVMADAGLLERVVANLLAQTWPPDQIVVISDNSTDATVRLARQAGAQAWESEGNTDKKAGALNQAMARLLPQLADDDFVFIQDADTLPAPKQRLRRPLERWSRNASRPATWAGWCWLRQTGAGPRRMERVSPRARAMKISGITTFSYFIV